MDFTSAIVQSPAAEQNAAENASEDWEEPNSYLSRLWNHPGGAPDILGLGGGCPLPGTMSPRLARSRSPPGGLGLVARAPGGRGSIPEGTTW